MKLSQSLLRGKALLIQAIGAALAAGDTLGAQKVNHEFGTFLSAGVPGEFEFGTAPSLGDLKSYAVVRPDAVEAVRQPLYDRQLYPTAGQNQMRFFALPVGQGVTTATGNTGVKTLEDTNMEAAAQLPSPKAFLATSIEVVFDPGSVSTANTFTLQSVASLTNASAAAASNNAAFNANNDINAVLTTGWLDFFLISKSYLTVPRLDSFPPKSSVQYDAAVSMSSNIGTMALALGRAVGRPYYVNPPVLIMPTTNFNVTLNWPVAVATPSGFNGRVMVRLDGYLYRNAQ